MQVTASQTNLRFHKTAQACLGDRKALVLAFQQLASAEPFTVSGRAAAGWLLGKTGPFPATAPSTEIDTLFQELYG
jgi:hypothetical protein